MGSREEEGEKGGKVGTEMKGGRGGERKRSRRKESQNQRKPKVKATVKI